MTSLGRSDVWLKQLKLGFMLLTRLPVPEISGELPATSSSAWSWPIVGGLIGALTGGVFLFVSWLGLPPVLSAFIAVAASILLTGAMHEDGLADLADGLGGGATVERKLEIMRDSRLGSYGAAAMILSIGMRVTAMAAFADPWVVFTACIGLSAVSRAFIPVILWLLPPARQAGQGAGASQMAGSQVMYSALIAIMFLIPLGVNLAPVLIIGMAISTGVLARWVMRQISGQTGDVLGAVQQVSEITGWLILVAMVTSS